ncbi:MAG: nuclear transport factor 2 family protein [Clostridia bacterium]|nr:nuclear transport factor 2 family protein [Clostridia bacterium]
MIEIKRKGFAFLFALIVLLCGCQRNITAEETTVYTVKESDAMGVEEKEVLAAFEKMQQAMIDKDIDTMYSLVTADRRFKHMSGKVQTNEEFFGEIADGTLNYYGYKIDNPVVEINGDRAVLTAKTTLKAKVYGISGEWTLDTEVFFVKVNGKWLQCNENAN